MYGQFFTGSKLNVAHLLPNPAFELMGHNVAFPLYVKVDKIYNLVCDAPPVDYQHDPVQTTKMSVHGATNMLGLANKVRAKILQASANEVYGDPEVHPQPEPYWSRVNSIGSRSCDDEGKRCAEMLFFDYWRQHLDQIKVSRIFNTYGPRMYSGDGRVVCKFIVQALKGAPLTIYGDGTQSPSSWYVDDLIDAMVSMMATGDGFTGPVNKGNPGEFTMLELVQQVLKLRGSNSEVHFLPLPADHQRQRQPDIALAKQEFGWQSKIALSAGLRKTIDNFELLLA